jgi:hypothetical protein
MPALTMRGIFAVIITERVLPYPILADAPLNQMLPRHEDVPYNQNLGSLKCTTRIYSSFQYPDDLIRSRNSDSDIYSGYPVRISARHRLSWLCNFLVFLNTSRHIPAYCLKLCHGIFLSHTFNVLFTLIQHSTVLRRLTDNAVE